MLKIYDCSINSYAPCHITSNLGPKENDMMFDLKRYQEVLGVKFVDDYNIADRIITNTTYTPEIIKHAIVNNIPLIKRMDGIFWRQDLVQRNIKLNEAALQSDTVIFISKFSQDCFHTLYDKKLKNEVVILNNVDNTIFYPTNNINDKFTWGASATNWNRKEKRADILLKFVDILNSNEQILLIGKSDIEHKNIINAGYIDDYNQLAKTINKTDAWVNFSYRDAAPKTVLQAIRCNKPVLYAGSGGLDELVNGYGLGIDDNIIIDFDVNNYELDFNKVIEAYHTFKTKYNTFKQPIHKSYLTTLNEYIEIIKNVR